MPFLDPAGRVFFLVDALPALGDEPSTAQLQALRSIIPPTLAQLPVLHRQRLQQAVARIPLADQALAHSLHLPEVNLRALAIARVLPREPRALVAQFAHWHAARDHIVLRRVESLDAHSATALMSTLEPLWAEAGWQCSALDTQHGTNGMLLRPSSDWRKEDLDCASSALAEGRNIELYLPRGARERQWRRMHNSVQMTWFDHPINQQRSAQGQLAVNALWLEGWSASPWLEEAGPWPSLYSSDASWRAAWPGPLAARESAHIIVLQAPAEPDALASWWQDIERSIGPKGFASLHVTGPDRWITLGPATPARFWSVLGFGGRTRARRRGIEAW